ncbi:MAG: response regulator [Anaerolineales bacterium]
MPNQPADKPIIRLIIADDHDMLRDGLRYFIDSFDDLELLAEATDGEQAIWYCQEHQPDVVLMDLKMPRLGGIEAIQRLKAEYPNMKFIVLTSFVEEDMVQTALAAGATGYLLKDAGAQDLYNAIQRAYGGQTMLAPEATQVLVQATTRPPKLGHDLTAREIEILQHLVHGLSNSEIGEKLFISRSTVKNHISSIFAKLQTDSRTEAAALAIQHNIVQLEEEPPAD